MDGMNQLRHYCEEHGITFSERVDLKEYCTFKIGGEADALVQPSDEGQIAELLRIAAEQAIPLLVLGKGSDILFRDSGYRGVVLHLGSAFAGMRLTDDVTIDCDAGATLMQLCLFAWEHGLSGLEFAYGIPGSVGGAIYMNAGAYGGEMKDVLLSGRHVCPKAGTGMYSHAQLELSYRHSVYSDSDKVITGGVFRLQKGDKTAIRERMDDYMSRRRTKQPLEYPSAGSTFKRPEGNYASALIDRCGLKGRRVGGAMVSEKHAGFVINAGGATGKDVRELIALIQREVEAQTGYQLACEVKIID